MSDEVRAVPSSSAINAARARSPRAAMVGWSEAGRFGKLDAQCAASVSWWRHVRLAPTTLPWTKTTAGPEPVHRHPVPRRFSDARAFAITSMIVLSAHRQTNVRAPDAPRRLA